MSNVVCLATTKKDKVRKETKEGVDSFIYELYDWCQNQGIDTTSEDFRWEAATIMTIIQGMLHKRDVM